MDRSELKRLAEIRLSDAKALLATGANDAGRNIGWSSRMAEAVLVGNESLSESARRAGRVLLGLVDAAGVDFIGAFWQHVEDGDRWRLCVVTRLADTIGPLEVYGKIRKLLYEMPASDRGNLDLSDIAVMSPDDLDVRDLRKRYGVVETEDSRQNRRFNVPLIYISIAW